MKTIEEKLRDVKCEADSLGLPPLLSRSWTEPTGAMGTGPTLKIMQWNALAQALTHGPDNFVKCPQEALSWCNRKLLILQEILTYSPDIICLQEVDRFDYFSSQLEEVGYSGMFLAKMDSPCLHLPDSTGPDGCAIFYNTSKLHLLKKENLNIYVPPDDTLCNQIAILASFKLTGEASNQSMHIVTTHLKAKTGYEALRQLQGSYLIETLKERLGCDPVVICGDFNGSPTEPLYKIFKESNLDLVSAYTFLNKGIEEPPYTTWKIRGERSGTVESCVTIDYMWLSRQWFTVESLLNFPSGEDIGPDRLPSSKYPSDHFSLVSKLVFKQENL